MKETKTTKIVNRTITKIKTNQIVQYEQDIRIIANVIDLFKMFISYISLYLSTN